MKVYFYYLKHPITDEIRYIGQTKQPRERLYSHIYNARKGHENNWRAHWIRSLLNEGLKPKMEIIEEIEVSKNDYEAVGKRERELIEQHFTKGVRLTNAANTPDPNALNRRKGPVIYQYDSTSLRQLARYESTSDASRLLKINHMSIRNSLTKSKLEVFPISGEYFWSYEDYTIFPAHRVLYRGIGRPKVSDEAYKLIIDLYTTNTSLSLRDIEKICKKRQVNISRETVRRTLIAEGLVK